MTIDPNQATIVHNLRPKANLIVKQGPQIGILFPITADSVILGREETCAVIVQDAEASRQHCELIWNEAAGAYFAQDLGSTNGTFVDGVQISAPTPLKSGSSIGIGQTTLVLEFEAGSPAAQVDYEAPNDATVIPGSVVEANPPKKQKNNKLLAFGCGCLLFLCVCAPLGLIALDLVDILDLGLPVISDLQVNF
jgi:pSer/pThr/pTyr-binding forkhead associated (FHA) protein